MTSDLAPGLSPQVDIAWAEGVTVVDKTGRRYIDLFGGAGRAILGHSDRDFIGAVASQAERIIVNRGNLEARAMYARDLEHELPLDLRMLGLLTTGAEAVDLSVRLARTITKRWGIIALTGAFHGRSGIARELTDPNLLGADNATSDVARHPFLAAGSVDTATISTNLDRFAALAATGRYGAVIVEPVQGTAGNVPAESSWIVGLTRLAHDHGLVVIADEVLSGFGRTGSFLAWPHQVCSPDLVVLGKAIANGLPMSAILASESVRTNDVRSIGGLSSTFGGNPISLSAAVATLNGLKSQQLLPLAARRGQSFLADLQGRLDSRVEVQGVTGRGLMIGVHLSHGLDAADLDRIDRAILDAGLIVGRTGHALRINPPLAITPSEAQRGAELLWQALADATAKPLDV